MSRTVWIAPGASNATEGSPMLETARWALKRGFAVVCVGQDGDVAIFISRL